MFVSICILLCLPTFSIESNFSSAQTKKPMLAIVIDDFGGYEQGGVETILSIDAPLTCAVMPNLENSLINSTQALQANKEVIVHMPMQAHVSIPEFWYGTNCIKTSDTSEQVEQKLNAAFKSVKGAKGFNIHIGSGVCQNKKVMNHIYNYVKNNDLFFLDSRTHIGTICQDVAKENNIVYLGRDEFLEPNGNKSYQGVKHHLMVATNLAKEKGYAIAIGHVGSHGGENTAKAIKDSINEIENMGVEIVPLSTIYEHLKNEK